MMNERPAKNRKKLSTRLFAAFFMLSLFAFLISTIVIVAVSWQVYEGDAEQRLVRQTEAAGDMIRGDDTGQMVEKLMSVPLADTRVTLVDADGSILFDTDADAASMGNHGGREEIAAAKSGQEFVVFRNSETTGADTLYAAVSVDDSGVVLRLSETRTSLLYYLRSLLVPLALAALLAVALSALLARLITRKTVSPLLTVDLNDPVNSEAYEEIEPLLARIETQRSELVEQNEQLERSVSMRREFTGNVSHEMKSPLQVIGGYAELIERGVASPEDSKRFAALIRTESESMRKLIDDVLLLSQLDEEVFEELSIVDMSSTCLRAADRLQSVAQARGVEVVALCEEGATVLGTEALVEQIAHNLLENAMRYGGDRVEMRVTREGSRVILSVSDNGAGISENLRERVFERFYRVDQSRSRETGGTGLGLAIVKHAAQSMGGTSRVVQSSMGGACFVIDVPYAQLK